MIEGAVIGNSGAPRLANSAYLNRMAARCGLLFAATLFGYPVIASVSSLLQLDNRLLSICLRIAVGLLSVWVLLTARRLQVDCWRKVMLLIWVIYAVRLLYDWLVRNLSGADFALQFFLISSALPAFALMKARVYQWHRFAVISFLIASAGALLGMVAAIFGSNDAQAAEIAGRLQLAALNPVTLGNQATSAILCGLVLWPSAKAQYRVVLALATLVLLWCLLSTGSKGPVLQLLFCVGLVGVRRGHFLKVVLLAAILTLLVWLTVSTESLLANRILASADDMSTIDRLVLIRDSFGQIEASPLIGSAFVELNSGYYPHNIFVEAALAFGLPIALLFTVLIAVAIRKAWNSLKTEYWLLALLFFQGLLDATLAGSLWGMTQLWVTLAMLPSNFARPNPSGQLGRGTQMHSASA